MTFSIGSILIFTWLSAAQTNALRCFTGDAAAAELGAAHETTRRAHLGGKAELMKPGMADQVTLVSNGNVSASPRRR